MNMEEVEKLVQSDTTAGEHKILEEDRERWKRIGGGSHLDEWLAFGPGLMLRPRLAMHYAHTNRPEGRGYNEALAALMARDGLDTEDDTLKASMRAVLRLHDNRERWDTLREIRDAMSPGDRARLNSPISAPQRVSKKLAEKYAPAEPGEVPEKPNEKDSRR